MENGSFLMLTIGWLGFDSIIYPVRELEDMQPEREPLPIDDTGVNPGLFNSID